MILDKLSFKYKFINNLLIYKNFTTKELYELYKQGYTKEQILNELINFIESNFSGNKQNLIGTGILKNFKKCNEEIENGTITDNYFDIDLYYTNYEEVEELINKLNKDTIIQELNL